MLAHARVRNLFTGSLLDPVLRFSLTEGCRYCVSSTCCVIFGTLTIFSISCGFCTSMICSTTPSTYTFRKQQIHEKSKQRMTRPHQISGRGLGEPLLCTFYELSSWKRIQIKWTIMMIASGRFVLHVFPLLLWHGTDLSLSCRP